MKPSVSIVIPTYNAERTIARALQSLRSQAYHPLDAIVIDASSCDDTISVVQRYRDLVSCLISERDRGQAHALNKGFARATGEIVGWLCADDELRPGALNRVAAEFSARPDTDAAVGGCEKVFEDGSRLVVHPPPYFLRVIGMQYLIDQPSTFWRRSLMEQVGALDESLYYAFDWDLLARMLPQARRIALIPEVLSTYYFTDHNKTSCGGRKLVLELMEVVRRYGPLNGRLAKIFYFLYRRFDLQGCYDTPPTCSAEIGARFARIIERLIEKYGRDLIYSYNWNFASKQERGLKWYL